ncbi:hypothetical protein [Aeromonas jandaei]|uniref:hypothetical protein n=1 Tax=Aeromonas jandaei TaxID=650 RepID=UPI003BA1F065
MLHLAEPAGKRQRGSLGISSPYQRWNATLFDLTQLIRLKRKRFHWWCTLRNDNSVLATYIELKHGVVLMFMAIQAALNCIFDSAYPWWSGEVHHKVCNFCFGLWG